MTGETLIAFVIVLFIVLIVVATRKPKREMSATERVSYESERGRMLAQQEFNNQRKPWSPSVWNHRQ
jgi:hypothetical protein